MFIYQEQDENTLNVKTAIGESYQCFLPKQDEANKESEPSYNGPSPLELLSPLFTKQACSYRVNTFTIVTYNTYIYIYCFKLQLFIFILSYRLTLIGYTRYAMDVMSDNIIMNVKARRKKSKNTI